MTTAPAPQLEDVETHVPQRYGDDRTGLVLFWFAVAFAVFQLTTSFGIPLDRALVTGVTAITVSGAALVGWLGLILATPGAKPRIDRLIPWLAMAFAWGLLAQYPGGVPSIVTRAMHVAFLCALAGGLLATKPILSRTRKGLLWTAAGIGLAVGLYQWGFYLELVVKAGDIEPHDVVLGVLAIAALLMLAWQAMGPALPIVATLFLLYCLFGQYLPPPLDHRSFSFEQVIEHMAYGTEGIYGTPTLVSATYIFLFILFGAFMERAGVVDFFNDLSMSVFGRSRGGPAKVAVASSAMLGTVSGSGVANVVASGQFTIPLMKRFGYSGAFAGGVEASASMGGQIMPPVMGAVAFIMAETIDVPYAEIVKAAVVPAMLYFFGCFWAVHLEAGRKGLTGLPADQLPRLATVVRERWFLVLPLVVLVYLLFGGFTPLFAGAVGVALTVIMIIGAAFAAGFGAAAVRTAFWVSLALVSAVSLWYSVAAVTFVVLALVVVGWASGRTMDALRGCLRALADGARQALPVGLACAVVGLVIGTMTLTGLGTIIGEALISIGEENLALTLVLTMIFSLFLGMGIPTIPNYIITSSLAAPILLGLDIPLIVSHMFVFYFGIMADLTPPVALAAFAAAPMARETGMRIAMQAVRVALPGFILPYIAVYSPELMLQPVPGLEGLAYLGAFVLVLTKALLAIMLWGIAAAGYFQGRATGLQRVLAGVAAVVLIYPWWLTDVVGFALAGAFFLLHRWQAVPDGRTAAGEAAARSG